MLFFQFGEPLGFSRIVVCFASEFNLDTAFWGFWHCFPILGMPQITNHSSSQEVGRTFFGDDEGRAI